LENIQQERLLGRLGPVDAWMPEIQKEEAKKGGGTWRKPPKEVN